MLSNLLRLARLTGRTELEARANALSQWAGKQARSRPTGFTALLGGLQFALGSPREVVFAGEEENEETQTLIQTVRGVYTPFTVVLHRRSGDAPITELAPFTKAQTPVNGQAAAYVCRDFRCEAPTTDPSRLREQLRE
jgi:uncharacterized protein YyaL (SSP411 family)